MISLDHISPERAALAAAAVRRDLRRRRELSPENILAKLAGELPQKTRFLLSPAPYKILYGGRLALKSWSMARALLILGCARPLRIMCARETQKSISESVHQLLSDQIDLMGIGNLYEIQESRIIGENGTEIFFVGLRHNIRNIKSLESVDIAWVEEAEAVSKNSWDTLLPTLRKEGSEIWVSFNPDLSTDDTYTRWTQQPPPGAIVVETNWRDNPWLTERNRREKDHTQATDPIAYEHIYEGATRSTVEGAIYRQEIYRMEKERRICPVPYEPSLPVDTFWDLGYGDMVSIVFGQYATFQYRVIDYYEDNHQAMDFYVKVLQAREYTYGTVHFPWDGGAKELGTGKSCEELVRAKGFKVKVMPQLEVHDGINAVRTIFPNLWIDNQRGSDLVSHLQRYQWGPMPKSGKLKRKPQHDVHSHCADAVRTMAVAMKMPKTAEQREQARGQQDIRRPRFNTGIPASQRWMA